MTTNQYESKQVPIACGMKKDSFQAARNQEEEEVGGWGEEARRKRRSFPLRLFDFVPAKLPHD
jgi:hypothetical protein